eukprot:g8209.t1
MLHHLEQNLGRSRKRSEGSLLEQCLRVWPSECNHSTGAWCSRPVHTQDQSDRGTIQHIAKSSPFPT